MIVFLAGTQGREFIFDDSLLSRGDVREYGKISEGGQMKVCLAGILCDRNMTPEERIDAIVSRRSLALERTVDLQAEIERERDSLLDIAILESFYYADEWTEWLIPRISHFMLDSGAFSFMQGAAKPNWDEYLNQYIDFINRNDVKLFFELDIDSIIGYPEVLKLRERLEKETGKKCIPVWHLSRGKENFLEMCEQYDYVAVGGIVSKEIKPRQYSIFSWLIREAHKRNAKIHGLGFTNLEGLKKYHFDSVDSTSWTTGNRFGIIFQFNGETMVSFNKPIGTRLSDSKKVAVHNFNEWLKFQEYAKTHL